jgi:probable addiction module antidote protein
MTQRYAHLRDEALKRAAEVAGSLFANIEKPSNSIDTFIVHALGVIARARNMSQLARDTGLTREGLYKALSPEGNPTFSTVAKVAKALGLQITVQTASTPLQQEKRITDSANA